MRAVGFFAPGGPEVLRMVELPEPHAGPGEVRIRVRTATVNPTDAMTRAGLGRPPRRGSQPPYVVGMEAAGEIDEAGEGTPWSVGDAVMAMTLPSGPYGGAYAEHIVVPAHQVVRAPPRHGTG